MGMLIIIKMALLSHKPWISYLKIALNYVNTVLFKKNVLDTNKQKAHVIIQSLLEQSTSSQRNEQHFFF